MTMQSLAAAKLWFFLAYLLLHAANGLKIMGAVDSMKNIEFLAKFAFRVEDTYTAKRIETSYSADDVAEELSKGFIKYSIQFPQYFRPKLVLLTSYNEWAGIRTLSCSELFDKADKIIPLSEQVTYTYSARDDVAAVNIPNLSVSSNNGNPSERRADWSSASGTIFFPQVDQETYRWGILYTANCDNTTTYSECTIGNSCQGPVVLNINMSLQNGNGPEQELSVDQSGMLGTIILLGFLQITNIVGAIHTKKGLVVIKKYHLTARLLMWSVFFQTISVLCAILFWGNYMDHGYPASAWNTLYHYAQSLAVACMVILLIMIGKGWTIVRKTLSHQGCLKLVGFSTFYVLAIIFAETYAYGYHQYDRMSQYFYESPPGALVLVLRCGVAPAWLYYAVYTTQKNFKTKRRFYKSFLGVFMAWLLMPAFFVLVAQAMPPVSLPVYTYIWESLLVYFAQWGLLMMYNPSANKVNASYPFHQNHLGEISNYPWIDIKAVRNVGSRNELRPMSHLLSNISKNGAQSINILEIYGAIKKCCDGIVTSADALIPKMMDFKSILRDWDVDDYEERDD